MSQSYSTITGSETAAQAKTKINNSLDALKTLHSGATDTAITTVAHMLWFDTTTDILKIRNAANSAWIDIGRLDDTDSDFHPIVGDWEMEHAGNDLIFSRNGTNYMKLSSTGSLTVTGDITAYGTI